MNRIIFLIVLIAITVNLSAGNIKGRDQAESVDMEHPVYPPVTFKDWIFWIYWINQDDFMTPSPPDPAPNRKTRK